MSIAHSQFRTFERQLDALRPELGKDCDLPARIENLLRRERAAGSRDRRLYRELHYTWLRHMPWLSSLSGDALATGLATLCAETPATHAFRLTFLPSSVPDIVAFISGDPSELLPSWLRAECPDAFEQPLLSSLNSRASLWARLQASAESLPHIFSELDALGWTYKRSDILPGALRIEGEHDLTRLESYQRGLLEIQDIGSQLILASQDLPQGGRWLDACAGAGGKTLQLSWLLGPTAHIEASDIRLFALENLVHRAWRAGIRTSGLSLPKHPPQKGGAAPLSLPEPTPAIGAAEISIVRNESGLYDGILIDAPCSGSGTWRRAPHLKWSNNPESIRSMAAIQAGLLDKHAPFVRPGGLLVYATCSLCRTENEDQVTRFLVAHPEFSPVASRLPSAGQAPQSGPGLRILPHLHDSDAFYVCTLRRAQA